MNEEKKVPKNSARSCTRASDDPRYDPLSIVDLIAVTAFAFCVLLGFDPDGSIWKNDAKMLRAAMTQSPLTLARNLQELEEFRKLAVSPRVLQQALNRYSVIHDHVKIYERGGTLKPVPHAVVSCTVVNVPASKTPRAYLAGL